MAIPMNRAGKAGGVDQRPVSLVIGGTSTPIPEPPRTLRDPATWTRLWTTGRAWLSNDAHHDLMLILCEAMEDRAALRRLMRRTRKITSGSAGQDAIHPALKQLDAMDIKIARMLATCGFSPQRQKQIIAPAKGRLDSIRERKTPPDEGV
jgi:hypothetical protein